MTAAIDTAGLKPGFARPVFDSQASFRRILDALAYAGRPQTLDRLVDAPAPLDASTTAIALTLLDFETPVWLDLPPDGEAANYLRFHAGARVTAGADKALFGIVTRPAEMPPLGAFSAGEDQYPDTSCTLVIQLPALAGGPAKRWTGPGIEDAMMLGLDGLPARFWQDWEDNHGFYPMGVDVIFAAGRDIVGLPRGVKAEE